MKIRQYKKEDETGWIRCRVLAFLDTAYFDNVLKEKETYENPAIELVSIVDNQIVGLLDIEYELKRKTICSKSTGLGGMIWHIAVHPDFRRKGIASKLLHEAEIIAQRKGLHYFEAWTRDDDWVNDWYNKQGFANVHSYLHVYLETSDEIKRTLVGKFPDLHPIQAFAHFVGDKKEFMKEQFQRVHECICYQKVFTNSRTKMVPEL
ncbi:GNAT family acetyltransferase [Alkalihalobacillus alcalophilus ATCC 27647 = CGMCC 1.3604]|uniref:GNAT family acetyltransferase n=1 Tax=Alkalihalobacillus alcalophilus ATCC 27647 = CGMCC 1.3604 TaxID=1218173 RepID=A0A094WNI4_ALKAL|nr:GNAT family N-acetyltransferase [Alkalihalobacillus alcalophilus]KGA98401.1 GNAT family acetyltransferase [Alkalihalobacillus alcalophilus ATCC 27647 = CGMCC 1.3604]MED1563937.1 GNAT family N-acetyltransferase [Alkalihalobacillus alcalophilus]THG91577.1 GNAT family acetyltransferase [Alkalihalobacillus alcalophilus ATCC 27647 = CGMCC 1.3604]